MPGKSFKVNIYVVELDEGNGASGTPFTTATEGAFGQPLGRRHKEVNGKGRRLEHHERRNGLYLLNFISFEFAGPGRSAPTTQAVPMGLNPDESFAHDTAMLYHPDSNLMLVESAQGSMGPGATAAYFSQFANSSTKYLLIPKLDNDAAARARRQQTIRSVIMRVAMGPVTDADHGAGLGAIKSMGKDFDAGYIDLEVKVGRERGRTLSLDNVWRVADSILGSNDTSMVSQLKVTGREHDDDELEVIDLIQHREKREKMLTIDDSSRKVPHDLRWDALVDVLREFR